MDIIYEDTNIICVNKPAGIPSQPDKSSDKSAFDFVKSKVKSDIFIINRIDRPVSGIILFAKNKIATNIYSKALAKSSSKKVYYAIVENKPDKNEQELSNFLIKKNNKAYITNKESLGKKAILNFKYIGKGVNYYYLKIELLTGRFHQIRVQLSNIGLNIKGDVKYGAKRANKDRSICLHAYQLDITDPFSGKNLSLKAVFPKNLLWEDLTKNIQ